MSKELSEAASQVLSLAKPFKALIALAEAAEQIDDLDNVAATKRGIIANLDKDIVERREESESLAAKNEEALSLIDESKLEAEGIIAAANTEAEKITAEATENGTAIIMEAKAKVAALQEEIDSMQERYDEIAAQTKDAEKQYEEVAGALQSKKDEIRAIIG